MTIKLPSIHQSLNLFYIAKQLPHTHLLVRILRRSIKLRLEFDVITGTIRPRNVPLKCKDFVIFFTVCVDEKKVLYLLIL